MSYKLRIREAFEWAGRYPHPRGEDFDTEIEVRQVFEPGGLVPSDVIAR